MFHKNWFLTFFIVLLTFFGSKIKGQVVAEIPVSRDVTPRGAFEYSVPLRIPPGIKNLVPTLAINYSSQSGNGLLGVGWYLSGISTITRGMPTLHHNNTINPVNFGSSDVLFLDGQRLLAIGSSKYQTEVKNFADIEMVGGAFIVNYPNGITYEYGNTVNSTMLAQGKTDVLMWAVNKVYDTHGNYITFEYTNTQSSGDYRISKITYGENSNTTTGIPVYINFNYTSRSDANASWIAGSKINSNTILSNIVINFSDNTEANKYIFTYDATNLTRLTKIEEKRNGSDFLPPINITWGATSNPVSISPIFSIPSNDVSAVGDFNGDGFTDMIQKVDTESYVYLNNGAGNFTQVSGANVPVITAGFNSWGPRNSRNRSGTQFDYNGDGMDDIVVVDMYNKGFKYLDLTTMTTTIVVTPFYEVWLYKANGNTSTVFDQGVKLYSKVSVGAANLNDNFNRLTHIQAGDFDGDGKSELFIAHPYNFNNSNSVADYEFIVVGEEYSNGHQIYHYGDGHIDGALVFDYNGDGRDEFAITHQYPAPTGSVSLLYGLDVSYNPTTHQPVLNQTPTHWPINHYCTSPIPYTFAKNWFGDFNGDGLDDILYWNTISQRYILIYSNADYNSYSNSNNPVVSADVDPDWPLPNLSTSGPSTNDHSLYVADFNGDGVDDILQFEYSSSTSNTTYDIYYSKGLKNFSHESGTFSFYVSPSYGDNLIGDYSGDGQADVILTNRSEIMSFYRNNNTLKVTSIEHAGKVLDIGYEYLARDNSYQPTTAPNSSYMAKTLPIKVVKTLSDGIDLNNTYTYSGLLYHKYGLGIRGFKTFNIENSAGQKTYSLFNLTAEFPYLSEQQVFDAMGSLPYGTKTFFAQINEDGGAGGKSRIIINYPQTVKDYTKGQETVTSISTGLKTFGTPFYDYGAIAATSVTKNDLNGNKLALTVTQNRYGTNWLTNKGKPDSIRIYNDKDPAGNNSITHLTIYKYNALGDIDTLVTDPSTANEKKTTYFYDLFGNVIRTELDAADPLMGPPLPIIVNLFEYTTDGKFKKKETDPELYTREYTYGSLTACWGNVLRYTNAMGVTESYQYDAVNRLIKTAHHGFKEVATNPSGGDTLDTYINYEWATSSSHASGLNNPHMVIISSNNDDAAISGTVIDIYGRTVRRISTGLNGVIHQDMEYNNIGLVTSSTSPYLVSAPFSKVTTVYSYDSYNRETYQSSDFGGAQTITDYDVSTGLLNTTVADVSTGNSRSSLSSGDILLSIAGTSETINYTYFGNGVTATATTNGETVEYYVDPYGRNIGNTQPNAGTTTIEYDALDRVIKQTLGTGIVYEYKYDKLGRILEKREAGSPAAYTYTFHPASAGAGLSGQLFRETTPNGYYTEYTYGSNGLLYSKVENNVRMFATTYNRSANGKLETYLYPRDVGIKYHYNSWGKVYLSETVLTTRVQVHKLWQFTGEDAYGRLTNAYLMSATNTTLYALGRENDVHGFPKRGTIFNNRIGRKIVDHTYSYNPASGNMLHRGDTIRNFTELFEYDTEYDRLTKVDYVSPSHSDLDITYADNGNILGKTDVSNSSAYPFPWKYIKYALEKVPDPASSSPSFEIPDHTLDDEYYSFQKIKSIKEDSKNEIKFTYGPGDERIMAEYFNGTAGTATPKFTKYYAENFEIIVDHTTGLETEIYYAWAGDELVGVFKVVVNPAAPSTIVSSDIYYPVRDQLGSITHLLDDVGNGGIAADGIIDERSYDAWGRIRDPNTWVPYPSSVPPGGSFPTTWITDRGYTGHEHLRFGTWNNNIINMNGRLYDPLVGRMFSPDPVITDPGNSQDYNKYTYARNNPLKYVDPDGKNPLLLIAGVAVGGGLINMAVNAGNINSFGDGVKYFGIGAGSSLIGLGIGAAVGPLASSIGGIGGGFISGAAAGGAGGFAVGAGNAWASGASFNDGLSIGARAGAIGFLMGGALGAINAAYADPRNPYEYGTGDPEPDEKDFPEFKKLWKNYPKSRAQGGESATGDRRFLSSNQCAMRLGKALRTSGVDIRSYPRINVTSDGLPRSSKGLADWLWQEFGEPFRMSQSQFDNIYKSNTGIMYLAPPAGGIGHIDLFNMGTPGSGYYQASEVWYWIIK